MEQDAPILTADQSEAASLIEEWFFHRNTQIFVLCGYAGTGKTFLVDYIVRQLGLVPGKSAVFVAPTGKAASVLIRAGVPAATVHSLIYTREEDIEVDENGEVISERFLRFVKKETIDERIRQEDPEAERINVPAHRHHYWRYRMPFTLERLLSEKDFNKKLKRMIQDAGR